MTKFNKKLLCLGTCISIFHGTKPWAMDPNEIRAQVEKIKGFLSAGTVKILKSKIEEYDTDLKRKSEPLEYQKMISHRENDPVLDQLCIECENRLRKYNAYYNQYICLKYKPEYSEREKRRDEDSERQKEASEERIESEENQHKNPIRVIADQLFREYFTIQTSIEMYCEEHYNKDYEEYKKAQKPLLEKEDFYINPFNSFSHGAISEIQKIIFDEIEERTKIVQGNPEEYRFIKQIFPLPKNTEVRVLDPKKFIDALHLRTEVADFFKGLMEENGKDDFCKTFQIFCDSSKFECKSVTKEQYKELVKKMVCDVAEFRPIREFFSMFLAQRVSLLSKSEMFDLFNVEDVHTRENIRYLFLRKQFKFEESDFSSAGDESVSLALSKNFYHTTFEGGVVQVPLIAQLIHEFGHILDIYLSVLKKFEERQHSFSTDTLDLIGANLQDVEVDVQQFKRLNVKDKMALDGILMIYDKKSNDKTISNQSISFLRNLFNVPESLLLQKVLEAKTLSPKEWSHFIYHSTGEFDRQFGLRYYPDRVHAKDSRKNVLVINQYCDSAMSAYLGFPTITSHLGFPVNDNKEALSFIKIKDRNISQQTGQSGDTVFGKMNNLYRSIHRIRPEQVEQNRRRIQEIVKSHTWPYKGLEG